MVKTPQFIAATLVCIKVLILRHDKLQGRFTYGDEFDMPHSVGDEVSVYSIDRRCSEALSGHIGTGVRQRERTDIERRGEQRPYPHACGVSPIDKHKYVGEEAEGKNIAVFARGVSDVTETILGSTLLGDRIRSVEYGRDNRQDGSRLS